MLLGPFSMRKALFPLAIVCSPACLLNLASAMALSTLKVSLVLVARGGLFFAVAIRDSFHPVAVVLLTVLHCHLASAMAHSFFEQAFVDVAIGELESALTVRAPIVLLSGVDVARGRPHFLCLVRDHY